MPSAARYLLPAGASTSEEELGPMPRMGGFELSFLLPFDRLAIYDELLVHPAIRHPLGASPNVAFAVLRPGYDPNNEVREGTRPRDALLGPCLRSF